MELKNKKMISAAVVAAVAISFGAYGLANSTSSQTSKTTLANVEVETQANGINEVNEVNEVSVKEIENPKVVAGIADVMNQFDQDTVAVSESDANQVAAGQEEDDSVICGYTNLGIAGVSDTLNIREAATTDSDIVGKMPKHSACEILETEGEWVKISSGKVDGYVKSEFLLTGAEALAIAEEERKLVAIVQTETLKVRSEANTDSSVITLVADGESIHALGQAVDGWVEVEVDDVQGYVSADYVTLDEVLPTAQTMTELKYGQGVSNVRVDLVSYACQFVGNPYVWGGTSLTKGADCSGFTMSVFAKYGIYLPHSSRSQPYNGKIISASEAKPGDLFFYGSGKSISHVGIYIGNGQIVHASNARTGIKISNAFYRTPICVSNVLGN